MLTLITLPLQPSQFIPLPHSLTLLSHLIPNFLPNSSILFYFIFFLHFLPLFYLIVSCLISLNIFYSILSKLNYFITIPYEFIIFNLFIFINESFFICSHSLSDFLSLLFLRNSHRSMRAVVLSLETRN